MRTSGWGFFLIPHNKNTCAFWCLHDDHKDVLKLKALIAEKNIHQPNDMTAIILYIIEDVQWATMTYNVTFATLKAFLIFLVGFWLDYMVCWMGVQFAIMQSQKPRDLTTTNKKCLKVNVNAIEEFLLNLSGRLCVYMENESAFRIGIK